MRWIKKGLRFECQPDCGHCCSQSMFGKGDVEGVFLSKRDVGRLQTAGVAWAIEERGDHRVLSEASGTCVFLDPRTKGCGIYDVRPTQCRNFPFTPGKDWRCCTARSKSLTSLCRLQSHPAQYVSGIPSAAILLSISHPIRCSTRCLANVRARISGPMIAL